MVAAWLAAVAGAAWAGELPKVISVGQPPFASERLTVVEGEFQFGAGGASQTIDARDLVVWGSLAEARSDPQILLADGGMLVADIMRSGNDQLAIDSPLFGELQLPLEDLAGVLLHRPADSRRR